MVFDLVRQYVRMPRGRESRLARLLDDQGAAVVDRCNAAIRLGKKATEDAFRALARNVFDPDFWIRAAALRALANIKDGRAWPFLLHLMCDPDGLVRCEARLAAQDHLCRFETSPVLDQFLEGAARGFGPFHVAAAPRRVSLSVLGDSLLEGKGINFLLGVENKVFAFHEGRWHFGQSGDHEIIVHSLDDESGIQMFLVLGCGQDGFSVRIIAEFPRSPAVRSMEGRLFFKSGLRVEHARPKSKPPGGVGGVTLALSGDSLMTRLENDSSIGLNSIRLGYNSADLNLGPGKVLLLSLDIRPSPGIENGEVK